MGYHRANDAGQRYEGGGGPKMLLIYLLTNS
jgi:hypothetical protein